ncbi:MAG TPA: GNAT family protein, partial [Longimicrobiaceae bacterium]
MPTPLGPPYRIETPRVLLRCWEPGDAPALSALVERNLELLRASQRWAADEPKPLEQRVGELRRWRAEFDLDRWWRYAVLDAGGGALLGSAVLFHAPARFAFQAAGWSGPSQTERDAA